MPPKNLDLHVYCTPTYYALGADGEYHKVGEPKNAEIISMECMYDENIMRFMSPLTITFTLKIRSGSNYRRMHGKRPNRIRTWMKTVRK